MSFDGFHVKYDKDEYDGAMFFVQILVTKKDDDK